MGFSSMLKTMNEEKDVRVSPIRRAYVVKWFRSFTDEMFTQEERVSPPSACWFLANVLTDEKKMELEREGGLKAEDWIDAANKWDSEETAYIELGDIGEIMKAADDRPVRTGRLPAADDRPVRTGRLPAKGGRS